MSLYSLEVIHITSTCILWPISHTSKTAKQVGKCSPVTCPVTYNERIGFGKQLAISAKRKENTHTYRRLQITCLQHEQREEQFSVVASCEGDQFPKTLGVCFSFIVVLRDRVNKRSEVWAHACMHAGVHLPIHPSIHACIHSYIQLILLE